MESVSFFDVNKHQDHYVPRFYLRGFRVPGTEQLYFCDKTAPNKGIRKANVGNVAKSRMAYSVYNDKILSDKENTWSEILSRLRDTPAKELNALLSDKSDGNKNFRLWLAQFIVDSKLRSLGQREVLSKNGIWDLGSQIAEFERDMVELKRGLLNACNNLKEYTQVEAAFSLLRDRYGLKDVRKYCAIWLHPFLYGNNADMYDTVADGGWLFDDAPSGRKFVTSDIPSQLLSLGSEPEFREYMYGFMPMSDVLMWRGFMGMATINNNIAPVDVDYTNDFFYRHAHRFVFSSSKDELERLRKGNYIEF